MAKITQAGIDTLRGQLDEVEGHTVAAGHTLVDADGPRVAFHPVNMRMALTLETSASRGPRIPQGRQRRLDRRNMAFPSHDGHRGVRCISRDQPWTEKAW